MRINRDVRAWWLSLAEEQRVVVRLRRTLKMLPVQICMDEGEDLLEAIFGKGI